MDCWEWGWECRAGGAFDSTVGGWGLSSPPELVVAVYRTGLADLDTFSAPPSSTGNFRPFPDPIRGLLCTLPTLLCATLGATDTELEVRAEWALLDAEVEVEGWLLLVCPCR